MGCRSCIPPSSLPILQFSQWRTALSSNIPPPPSYPLPLMIIWVSPSVEIRALIQHCCLPPISKIMKFDYSIKYLRPCFIKCTSFRQGHQSSLRNFYSDFKLHSLAPTGLHILGYPTFHSGTFVLLTT